MALFEYFPNYIWNLSVAIALESGGRIGEIVDMCQPIRDAAANGGDAGTPQFMQAWSRMGDSLLELKYEDEAKGRAFFRLEQAGARVALSVRCRTDAGSWSAGS